MMPRQAKQASRKIGGNTLVLDNGAYTMKAGFVTDDPDVNTDCHIIPNCIARRDDGRNAHKIYVADQLDECKDFAEMQFRRPVEKGYLVNWDGEMDIWKRAFFDDNAKLHCDPHETNLILTEAPNCPQALQLNSDQMIFEGFEFASAYRCLGSSLNAYNDIAALTGDPQSTMIEATECMLLVDSGYSHSTITPLINGSPVHQAIRRLDIGGKLLTNFLKEIISLRHFSLMDDPYLVTQIKEDACFVTQNFNRDLLRTWKGARSKDAALLPGEDEIVLDYVLPDYRNTFRGYVRPHNPQSTIATARLDQMNAGLREDFFPLGNERFVVPELLFNPSDIGLTQAGLPEIIIQSLQCLPQGLWPVMLANVVVVGGNARIKGFMERLEKELRSLTPSDITLRVRSPWSPLTYTWLGGARFASDEDRLKGAVVTKQEYQEYGGNWTLRKFATGSGS